MKILLSFLISFNLMAAKAVVIALEAPLQEKPIRDAKVVQTFRKGDIIYIHDMHAPDEQYTRTFDLEIERTLETIELSEDREAYFKTVDKKGLPAYIKKKYIKMIYKDHREDNEPVAINPDPTDYRLEEPLPKDYPLNPLGRYKASIKLGLGPNLKSNYPYNAQIVEENYKSRMGFSLEYLKKASFDEYNRLHFGAKFHYLNNDAEFKLEDGRQTKESVGQFGIGPMISYDVFKDEKYITSFFGGFTLNYNRAFVTQKASNNEQRERFFNSLSISPEIGFSAGRREVFPDIDLIVGSSMQFHFDYTIESSSTDEFSTFWNTDPEINKITYPTGAHFQFFVGVTSNY